MRFAPLSVTVIDCGDPAAVAPTRLELEELMAPNGAGPTATLRLLAGASGNAPAGSVRVRNP